LEELWYGLEVKIWRRGGTGWHLVFVLRSKFLEELRLEELWFCIEIGVWCLEQSSLEES